MPLKIFINFTGYLPNVQGMQGLPQGASRKDGQPPWFRRPPEEGEGRQWTHVS